MLINADCIKGRLFVPLVFKCTKSLQPCQITDDEKLSVEQPLPQLYPAATMNSGHRHRWLIWLIVDYELQFKMFRLFLIDVNVPSDQLHPQREQRSILLGSCLNTLTHQFIRYTSMT